MHHQGRESGYMGPTTHADRSFRETVAHSGLGRLGAEVTDTAPECRAETIQRVHHVGPGDQIQIIRLENKCPTLILFTFLMSEYLTMRALELNTEHRRPQLDMAEK